MKTTITAIVGVIALLAAKFGFDVDVQTQLAIVTVVMFFIGLFSNSGNTPKAA
jgi:phage shock protein PspC (stress-responsive transcriptional regulator)